MALIIRENKIINKEFKETFMTKIKNLQMAETVCNDMRIKITESFFGLCCKAIFMPTNSKIDAKTLEYSPEIGGRLNTILNMPHDKLVSTLVPLQRLTETTCLNCARRATEILQHCNFSDMFRLNIRRLLT